MDIIRTCSVTARRTPYQSHPDWLREVVCDRLELSGVTVVCHDWGGLLGLRLLGEQPDRFRRVVATSTSLPTGRVRRTVPG
ncbi:alpha/beta fold hydrolase [Kribbella sp. NPDC048928]|uniref:alpha/beta fold hydrolase n=1 Tax=Kribbella sp. NPDC048928 TaxID=3364111 RepID=UPI00371BC4D0